MQNKNDLILAESADNVGYWSSIQPAPGNLLYVTCSECKKTMTLDTMKFCSNCGARILPIEIYLKRKGIMK